MAGICLRIGTTGESLGVRQYVGADRHRLGDSRRLGCIRVGARVTTIRRGPYAGMTGEAQVEIERRLREMYTEIIVNGERMLKSGDLTYNLANGYTAITNSADPYVSVNQCEHCHRSDIRQKVAHSIDDAIEFGWLVPFAHANDR